MKNLSRCYICYEVLNHEEESNHYHKKCLYNLFHSHLSPVVEFSENDIASLAKEFVNRRMGIPGVQRKLSVSLETAKSTSDSVPRITIVGYLEGNYILKPPTEHYPYMPEIEDLTMHLADVAQFRVAPHGLVKLKNNSLAYITKRFDRVGKQKIAVEDLCQLSLKRTVDKYKSSSEKSGKVIQYYSSNPGDDCLIFFELLFFSFLVGNADMHLKNFSLITEDIHNIHMAPCYDLLSTRLLISEYEDSEELALTLNGKKSNLRKKDFLLFGKNMDISEKVLIQSMNRLINYFPQWQLKIRSSFVPYDLQEKLIKLIQTRIEQIT